MAARGAVASAAHQQLTAIDGARWRPSTFSRIPGEGSGESVLNGVRVLLVLRNARDAGVRPLFGTGLNDSRRPRNPRATFPGPESSPVTAGIAMATF